MVVCDYALDNIMTNNYNIQYLHLHAHFACTNNHTWIAEACSAWVTFSHFVPAPMALQINPKILCVNFRAKFTDIFPFFADFSAIIALPENTPTSFFEFFLASAIYTPAPLIPYVASQWWNITCR